MFTWPAGVGASCFAVRRRGGDDLGGDSGPRATPRATSAVNDAWIAACCLVDGLPLATFNTKDFADFAQYDGLRLIDAERRG